MFRDELCIKYKIPKWQFDSKYDAKLNIKFHKASTVVLYYSIIKRKGDKLPQEKKEKMMNYIHALTEPIKNNKYLFLDN